MAETRALQWLTAQRVPSGPREQLAAHMRDAILRLDLETPEALDMVGREILIAAGVAL